MNVPTGQSSRSHSLIYRLIEVTEAGSAIWNPVYPEPSTVSNLAEITRARAFVLDDPNLGFGVVAVSDPGPEDRPALYISGEEVRAGELVPLLLEGVKEQFARLQVEGPESALMTGIERAIGPLADAYQSISERVAPIVQTNAQLTETVLRLTRKLDRPVNQPSVPLTPDTLKSCLRELVGDAYDEAFSAAYDEDTCRQVVDRVVAQVQSTV